MLKEIVQLTATEVGKRVAQTVGEVSAEQASSTLKTLARSGAGLALLPGVGAFVVGVAVGAGLGVLFAPRAGSETRRALKARLSALAPRGGLERASRAVERS